MHIELTPDEATVVLDALQRYRNLYLGQQTMRLYNLADDARRKVADSIEDAGLT